MTFRPVMDDLLVEMDRHVSAPEEQVEQIDAQLRQAEARQTAYEQALAAWHVTYDEWASWQAPMPVAS